MDNNEVPSSGRQRRLSTSAQAIRKSASFMVSLIRGKPTGPSSSAPDKASMEEEMDYIGGCASLGPGDIRSTDSASIRSGGSMTAVEHLLSGTDGKRGENDRETPVAGSVSASDLNRADLLRRSKHLGRTDRELSDPEMMTSRPRVSTIKKAGCAGGLRLAGELPIEQLEAMRLNKARGSHHDLDTMDSGGTVKTPVLIQPRSGSGSRQGMERAADGSLLALQAVEANPRSRTSSGITSMGKARTSVLRKRGDAE